MDRARTSRAIMGAGLATILFGALTLVAPGAAATDGDDGVHGVDHNADLNENQRGTNFEGALEAGECDDAPEGTGPYAWHFVTEGQDEFGQLNVDFQTATNGIDVDYVAHPDHKHAYVSTGTADTLLDATATVSPGPEGEELATFQLSHTCDLSGEEEEDEEVENSLTVVKAVTGEVPTEWEFDFSGDLDAFALDEGDTEEAFDELDDGSFAVTEATHDTATLADIDCEAAEGDADFTVDDRTVTVDLEGGDDVTCTFTNDFPEVGGESEERETTTPAPEVDEDEQVLDTVEEDEQVPEEDQQVLGDDQVPEEDEQVLGDEQVAEDEEQVVQEDQQPTTTADAEVMGDVQQRAALPRTGSTSQLLTAAGLALLALGTTLVAGSRRRLARVTA